MPELPDVEVFKRYVDSTSLHKRITGVDVSDSYVIKNIDKESFRKNLEGQILERTHRHGKYLFLKLSGCNELLVHFGMTGFPKYFKKEESKPEHGRLQLTFDNGYHLAYSSQRKLGEVRIVEDYQVYIDDMGVGADALDKDLDRQTFVRAFNGRSGMIKSALMNQEIIAGIGNVYSDEILFHAGLHPESKASALSENDWEEIYNSMRDVMKTAIDCNVDKDRFPGRFILPNRGEGVDCPKGCSGKLRTPTVSGRTACYCPKCQKKK